MRWLNRPTPWPWLFLLMLSSLVFLSGLTTPGLYDPNEGLYAEIAWEMHAHGDWLTPHFNRVPYFEKPPLLYWFIATAYRLFGVSEAAARLPVALAAVAGVLFTFAIGRALFTPRAGLLAGLALTTSFGYFIFARVILTDLLLTVWVTAALWGFLRGYLHPERRNTYLLAYAFSALAVLTKGLLGLAIPGLTIGGLMVVTREWKLVKEMRLPLGLVLFLAIAAPWHLAVGWVNPGSLWFYFINEHVLRFLNRPYQIDYVPVPFWLFLLLTLVWSFPWSVFLPFAWRHLIPPKSHTRHGQAAWLVPCWIGAVLGFFALTPARLEYYSLPVLPALALWVGRFWDQALGGSLPSRWLRWPLACLLGLSVSLVPLAASFPRLEGVGFYNMFSALDVYYRDLPPTGTSIPSFRALLPTLLLGAGTCALGAALAFVAAYRGRPRLAFGCLIALMLGTFPLLHHGLVLFEPYRSIRMLGLELRHARRPGDLIVVEGPYENFAALNVYTRGSALLLNGRSGDLEFGSHRLEAQAQFMDDERFHQLWRSGTRVFLLTGSASRVTALRRQGEVLVRGHTSDKWLVVNRP